MNNFEIYILGVVICLLVGSAMSIHDWYLGESSTIRDIIYFIVCILLSWGGVCIILYTVIRWVYKGVTIYTNWDKVIIKGKNMDKEK